MSLDGTVHLNPCVRGGARVRAATIDAVKHVSQIAPLTGEANCRARHQRNILAGSAFVAYSLLRLGLQVGVYSYSAACDHHPLFPRLIAPLLQPTAGIDGVRWGCIIIIIEEREAFTANRELELPHLECDLLSDVPGHGWPATSEKSQSRFARAPSEPGPGMPLRRLELDSRRSECSVLPKGESKETMEYRSCGFRR